MTTELDPRVVRTREVVVAATIDLLAEVGFERISIDAIAERSGVARSTIYRNWSDRTILLAEAFRELCAEGPGDLAPSSSLVQDLEGLAHLLVRKLTSDNWSRTVPSLIGAATGDDSMRELMATFSRQRREEAGAIFTRAIERGEITRSDQLDSALERFVAPFFFRRLMSQLPLDDTFIKAQVEATLDQLRWEQ